MNDIETILAEINRDVDQRNIVVLLKDDGADEPLLLRAYYAETHRRPWQLWNTWKGRQHSLVATFYDVGHLVHYTQYLRDQILDNID